MASLYLALWRYLISFDYKVNGSPKQTVTINKDGSSNNSYFNGDTLSSVLQNKVLVVLR